MKKLQSFLDSKDKKQNIQIEVNNDVSKPKINNMNEKFPVVINNNDLSSVSTSSSDMSNQSSKSATHNPSYLCAINLDTSNHKTNIDPKYLSKIPELDYVLQTTDSEDDLPVSPIHHIIIDCSPFNYVDSVGIQTISQVTIKKINLLI